MKTIAKKSDHNQQKITASSKTQLQKPMEKDSAGIPDHRDSSCSQSSIDSSPVVVAQRIHLDHAYGEAIQRQIPEEEEGELLQGKFPPLQRQPILDEDEEELLQGKFPHRADAPLQVKTAPPPNKTGLPDNLKASIESLSGIDMDDVRVQRNSSKPAQLNALAYTQGNEIHLGPGQERHLPHEAWHAVQQKQGRVRATRSLARMVLNDDSQLESEADRMGAKALTHPTPQPAGPAPFETNPSSQIVQRAVGIEFETAIPVYKEATEEKAARRWKRYQKRQTPKRKQLLEKAPSSVKYSREIKDFPDDCFRLAVDHFGGIRKLDDEGFPPLLLGKKSILELTTHPIDDHDDFVETARAMKDYMTEIFDSWGTDENEWIKGYSFGPADKHAYPEYTELQDRRSAVKKSFKGKVQVSFGIDPHWIHRLFSSMMTGGDKSHLPKTKRFLRQRKGFGEQLLTLFSGTTYSMKNLTTDPWQEDMNRALVIANERVDDIKEDNEDVGDGDGLKSIFTFWAFYLLRGARKLLFKSSEKNIPKFLLKASYIDLWNLGLNDEERDVLKEDEDDERELKAVIRMTGVKKKLNSYLFDAVNPKGHRKDTDFVVEDLIKDEKIIAPTEKISPVGVRDTSEAERDEMLSQAYFKKGAKKHRKKEVVFEGRSIGKKKIDDLVSIFDYYHNLTEEQNVRAWVEESESESGSESEGEYESESESSD